MDLPAETLPRWFVLSLAFLFGAAWGSFLNVAIYRWPRGLSVVSPGSACPACGTPVAARYNIPIFGFLLLRGKTACCQTPLSPRYALVELLTAVLSVAVAQHFFVGAAAGTTVLGASLVTGLMFVFVCGLIIVTFVDLERMEIPDEVSLPCAALGLATAPIRDLAHVGDYALGAGGGFLAIQLLFVWGYERLTGRRGMGEGDSKLLLMIGAFLGWQGAAFSVVAAAIQGILVALYGLLSGQALGPDLDEVEAEERAEIARALGIPPEALEALRREHERDPDQDPDRDAPDGSPSVPGQEPEPTYFGHTKLPFGPFLALGALEYLFFGDALVGSWLGLVEGMLPLATVFPT